MLFSITIKHLNIPQKQMMSSDTYDQLWLTYTLIGELDKAYDIVKTENRLSIQFEQR